MHVPFEVSATGEPRATLQELAPALIVTLPVGAEAPDPAVTEAVTDTDCPNTAIAGLTVVTAVDVAIAATGFTVCETEGEAMPLKLASPEYVAMRFLAPEVVGVRLHDVAGKVIVQLTVPSETMIVPVGVPLPGAVTLTPAVTAIAALTVDGSGVCAVIAAVVVALLTVTLPLPAPLDALGANAGAPAYAAFTV